MKVWVTTESRYKADREGNIWTFSIFDYSYFQRYLRVFEEVRVLARVEKDDVPADKWKPVDGKGVIVQPLPGYVGPEGFVRKFPAIMKAINRVNPLVSGDAVILRSGNIAWLFYKKLQQMCSCYPYGLEVAGDPLNIFASGSVEHPLRRFFLWHGIRNLKRLIGSACAVAYVTEKTLQKRYPPNENAFTTYYSNVDLFDDAFAPAPRNYYSLNKTFKLVSVGSMAQRYKGFDTLIQAVKECAERGLDLKLTLVGDGKHRVEFEGLTKTLGLEDRVTFTGELPGPEAVRQVLKESDLYVHPSRAEGLPRALIEAMAQGLPCIGSNVGGIPELLPPEDLVKPGDVQGLAVKICEVLSNPERMNQMSERNLVKAKEFHYSVLQKRRDEFYRYVRKCTEEYLARSCHKNQKL